VTRSPCSPRAAAWLRSGPLDVEFYAALRGQSFDDPRAAAEDFVEHGMPGRLSPHPFLDFASLPPAVRKAWRRGRVKVVLEHLAADNGGPAPAGPLSSPEDPAAARARMLSLARRLGAERDDGGGAPRGDVDWTTVGSRSRTARHTSVVVVAGAAASTTDLVNQVWQVLPASEVPHTDVVLVDPGTPPHVALSLEATVGEHPGVRTVRVPRTASRAAAVNLAIAQAQGEVVLLLGPGLRLRPGVWRAVDRLFGEPDVAGVQPLVLRPDDMIRAAGLVVPTEGGTPVPLLEGHPKEDADRLGGERLAALSGEAMVVRVEDVAAVGGLDAVLPWPAAVVDLCARLLPLRSGAFRLSPTALVTLGRVADPPSVSPPPPHPGLPPDPGLHERIGLATGTGRRAARTAGDPGGGRGGLRWSLNLPSPAGARGDRWGDTHFADALADALRGLGQDVVSRRRGAHTSGPVHLDDVSLALRGLRPIPPTPGRLNVLWVISHPEDVDPREFEGYDVVCAASTRWSADMAARTGRRVTPLLQATSFRTPEAGSAGESSTPEVVFVGSTDARRHRALVWHAVEAGVPLAVYGRGWEELPDGVWRGDYVDNHRLPEIYRRHGIVLADHWPDMARHGFIANRVFDAVASGARVVCDDVVGVHEVFDRRDVMVARSPAEVASAVAELTRSSPDQDVPRPPLSFLDRARTLLDLVAGA